MTLVVGLRCREGAILAADDKLVFRRPGGAVTRTSRATKLLASRGIAWGWAGGEDAQQRFGIEVAELRTTSSRMPRSQVQDELEDSLRSALAKIPDSDTVQLSVLAGWWSPGAGKAVLLSLNGTKVAVRSTFVDASTNVTMIGSRPAQALAEHSLRTLGFGDFREVGIEEAKTLATKVIADVSAGTDDVGRPTWLTEITEAGVNELDREDVAALASAAATWTTELRATLVRETTPAESSTDDPGIGPPA